MPRWAQSIRFRLSLAYALAVFAVGAVFIAAVYAWQAHQLSQPPDLRTRHFVYQDPVTGAEIDTDWEVVLRSDFNRFVWESLQRQAYAESLNDLRSASLVGLGLLSVVAFGTGWLLAGWTLGPISRITGVARDISGTEELARRIALDGPDDELKGLADTFDEMLDRLQASFEQQRRFVQDASHELRNPLAIAQANLELALDDPDASVDDLRRSARIAHESNGRISQIVEDLVVQARSSVPRAMVAEVDLVILAAEVTAEMAAPAARRGLTLVTDSTGAGATGAIVVHGDGAALRRAVTNLAANAVRLAPAGSTITVATGRRGDRATIAVVDQGPGIAEDHQRAVFERFWRGSESGKGLGLGLSIVRQVAERHGGTVELESQPGVGSTFTIVLPLPVGAPPPSASPSAAAPPTPPEATGASPPPPAAPPLLGLSGPPVP
ncbi:MAG: HAMP domain-containing sensor histidine kinase [Acidimicrobiales bacterium]